MAATPADCVQIVCEESPRPEGADLLTPYRLSTDECWVPATSVKLDPVPSYEDRSDELRGIEGGIEQLIEAYNPTGTLNCRPYLNQMTWLLHAAGLEGTPTAGDGIITDPDTQTIPVGATRWTFAKRGGVEAKSLQIIAAYVSDDFFQKGQGYGVSEITWDTGGPLQASLVGLVAGRLASDPQLVPAYDAPTILPVRRGNLKLTWLAGGAAIDDGFTFTLSNPLNQMHSAEADTPSFYPDKLEHGDERVTLRGTVPKHNVDPDDYDKWMEAGTFAASAHWTVPVHIGATTYHYQMWLDIPNCQLIGGDGAGELRNARRHPASYGFFAAWDFVKGYDFKFTLVNAVTDIETYA